MTPAPPRRHRLWIATLVALFCSAMGIVWLPELFHYYVPTPRFGNSESTRIVDGIAWPSSVLDTQAIGVIVPPLLSHAEPVELARKIMAGEFVPGYDVRPLRFPADPEDVAGRSPEGLLSVASLAVPHLFLQAYTATNDIRYLAAAASEIQRWSHFERRAFLPTGFLWNDHAVAARTGVLIRFLATARNQPSIGTDALTDALTLAVRGLRILAKKSHFTFRTNHGVMQNLALLEGAALLHTLPESASLVDEAIARLHLQLSFFIGEDGFVREDSPGYHLVGEQLLNTAITLLKQIGRPVPASWSARSVEARALSQALVRPDGTLPVFGDTDGVAGDGSRQWAAVGTAGNKLASRACPGLYPRILQQSGLAVFWGLPGEGSSDCLSHQMMVKWGHWPGHGHQVPDEMAITLWSGNTPWITNLGYWPYGLSGRKFAESWESSNAPHLVGESANNNDTRLVSGTSGVEGERLALHLRRRLEAGGEMHRQVIVPQSGLWVVLDSRSGNPKTNGLEVIWTTAPEVSVTAGGVTQRAFSMASDKSPANLTATLSGADEVRLVRGEAESPFGWTVAGKVPRKTVSVVARATGVTAPLVVTSFQLAGKTEDPGYALEVVHWKNEESWLLRTEQSHERTMLLSREGNRIRIEQAGSVAEVQLMPMVDAAPLLAADKEAISTALAMYPPWKDLLRYRKRVSLWLVGVGLCSLAVLVAVKTAPLRRFEPIVLGLLSAFWLAANLLVISYLGT